MYFGIYKSGSRGFVGKGYCDGVLTEFGRHLCQHNLASRVRKKCAEFRKAGRKLDEPRYGELKPDIDIDYELEEPWRTSEDPLTAADL